jgi:hypothetical protein
VLESRAHGTDRNEDLWISFPAGGVLHPRRLRWFGCARLAPWFTRLVDTPHGSFVAVPKRRRSSGALSRGALRSR